MLALAAVLAVLPLVPAQAQAPAKPMVCGAVSADDVQEIFSFLLYNSGYDSSPADQRPWGKPSRGATTGIFTSDEKSFRAFGGSPAAAFAANTGINNKGAMAAASHVYIHIPSMCDINQNRGEAAFFLAHELSHLVLHHPEMIEKNNLDSMTKWCESNDCDGDPKRIVASWERATREARNAFQRDIEQQADREARQWITTLTDPATGKIFSAEAGEAGLKSAEEWLKAKGETLDDPTHGSLASRVQVLAQDREQMAKSHTDGLKGKAEAIQQKVGNGF
jgi:hypothetical protein